MSENMPITKRVINERDTEIRFFCQLALDNGHKPKVIYEKLAKISGLSETTIRDIFYSKVEGDFKAVVNS